jgi:hypothetical protein
VKEEEEEEGWYPPSMLGIEISMRTKLKGLFDLFCPLILETALSPLQANSMQQPMSSKMVDKIWRQIWSCSTIST